MASKAAAVADLKIGDVVCVHNWHGVVLETNYDETGTLSVIRVQTVRNVFRGYGPEYIDVRLDPEAITRASMVDLEKEIQTHRRVVDGAVGRLREAVDEPEVAAD
jgi:hypothetical protein